MTWNYRLIRHQAQNGHDEYYAIHEVYYDDNGRAFTMTVNPVGVIGDTVDDVKSSYEMMSEALRHPILDATAIPEPGVQWRNNG